jgi:hypothetical protein
VHLMMGMNFFDLCVVEIVDILHAQFRAEWSRVGGLALAQLLSVRLLNAAVLANWLIAVGPGEGVRAVQATGRGKTDGKIMNRIFNLSPPPPPFKLDHNLIKIIDEYFSIKLTSHPPPAHIP